MVCMEMDFCPCWGFQLDTEISELWVGRNRKPWGATARVASESSRSGQPSRLPCSYTSSRSHVLLLVESYFHFQPFTSTLYSS